MTPVEFPYQNKTLTKPANMTDDQCGSLPVFNDGVQSISCWRMSWRERLAALFLGRVWLQVYAGETQPPVSLTVARTVFVKRGEAT
jgi:hypothetical protein